MDIDNEIDRRLKRILPSARKVVLVNDTTGEKKTMEQFLKAEMLSFVEAIYVDKREGIGRDDPLTRTEILEVESYVDNTLLAKCVDVKDLEERVMLGMCQKMASEMWKNKRELLKIEIEPDTYRGAQKYRVRLKVLKPKKYE